MSQPTQDEINDVLDWCMEAEETGTNYSGMTYEQGVQAALEWIEGRGSNPKE